MRLLKNNLYEIVRLCINQVGITIFSLVLYTAIGMIDGDISLTLKIWISAFAIIFYFFLIYTVMWENGAKDAIKIETGRMEREKGKGLLMGVYANAVNFLLAFLSVFAIAMYINGGSDFYFDMFGIVNFIMRFFAAMYIGVLQGVFLGFAENENLYYLLQSIGFIVLPIFAVLVTHFGYVMGLKNRKIFNLKAKK